MDFLKGLLRKNGAEKNHEHCFLEQEWDKSPTIKINPHIEVLARLCFEVLARICFTREMNKHLVTPDHSLRNNPVRTMQKFKASELGNWNLTSGCQRTSKS